MVTDQEVVTGFRAEVRRWLAEAPRPEGLHDYGPTPSPEDVPTGRVWQRQLHDAGYAGLHWPAEHGGRDASVADQAAFAEECAEADVPRQLNIVGPDLVGPILMRFGTEAQKEQFLPEILTGGDMWCQLFSEPDAGSDLAAVRTRAARQADGTWIVDGQKVWTSGGVGADFGLLLARTGGSGHGGLSVFVVPMATDGIEIRPLRQMDGEAKFNEVYFTGARLPADAIVGEEGGGWKVATATLGRERLSLGANAVGMFRALAEILEAADQRGRRDLVADGVASLWVRTWLLRTTWERAIEEGAEPGAPAFSVLKLLTSETYREIGDLGTEALGADAALSEDDEPLVRRMLVAHAQTILGGTSEIQRNILAERLLGLPREPAWQS